MYRGQDWGWHKLDLGEGIEYFWEYDYEEEAEAAIAEVQFHGCSHGVEKQVDRADGLICWFTNDWDYGGGGKLPTILSMDVMVAFEP